MIKQLYTVSLFNHPLQFCLSQELQIYLKSHNGPIDVYLCPDNPENEAQLLSDPDINVDKPAAAEASSPDDNGHSDSPSAYSDSLDDLALVQEAIEANSRATESNPPTPAKIATLVQTLQSETDQKGFYNPLSHVSSGTRCLPVNCSPMKPGIGMLEMPQAMAPDELPSSGSCPGDELSFIPLSPPVASDWFFSLDNNEGISDLFETSE